MILVESTIIVFLLALLMLSYGARHDTFAGFGLWTASIFAMSLANLAIVVRPVIPLLASVIVTNIATVASVVLGLDGTLRFYGGKGLRRLHHVAGIVTVTVYASVLTLVWNRFELRTTVTSVLCCALLVGWSRVLWRHGRAQGGFFARLLAVLLVCWGGVLVARAGYFLAHPQLNFQSATTMNYLLFLSAQVTALSAGLTFIVINSERIQLERNEANARLTSTVALLQKSLGEIKILEGIIPICSYCKSVRVVDSSDWKRIDEYISTHSNAQFSHGVCPTCLKKHWGGGG
jgi:hypothetical protein